MTKINNNPTITNDERVTILRNAIEHRATWMGLILDEAEKDGQNWEGIARKAIHRCGCFHGQGISEKLKNKSDLKEFTDLFINELVRKAFEMDIVELTEDKLAVEFHYCPLVSAWQKQNLSEDMIETLCDIAMDGDRGIGASAAYFDFELGKTIAQGNPVCEIFFRRTKE